MEEKIRDVLNAYPFQVNKVCRGRGAFICHTDQGLKIVKVYNRAPQRLELEQLVKSKIRDKGYTYVDQFIANQEGGYLNYNNEDGLQYTVRDWYEGHECDVRNPADILSAARQLAALHLLMQNEDDLKERAAGFTYEDTRQNFLKHRKELKSIHSYIRNKKRWNDFEKTFMKLYTDSMAEIDDALRSLDIYDFEGLRAQAIMKTTFCHGDFNYHQIILNRKYTAIINFDKMHVDIQVKDLYQFLRKIMEKNNWDSSLGFLIIDTYRSVRKLSDGELYYIYSMLMFPEKFWKISNRYYNSRKSWVSQVNYDKLCQYREMNDNRKRFIELYKYSFIF